MLAPVTDHAVHSIILLLPHGKATLADVAKNLSQSDRALQRALAIEGKTFFELLNDVRRSLAQSYLLQTSQSLTWIASSLAYANQSSFTRWFEREFEAAPSLWRRTHRENLRLS
jgi:AraC-like DNA-binding protein